MYWIVPQIISIGQVISLKERIYKTVQYESLKQNPTLGLPEFLERTEEKKGQDVGKLIDTPSLADVPFELQSRFISELYANVKIIEFFKRFYIDGIFHMPQFS